jgi:predicted O-methyltransferase YrrM
LFGPVDAGHLSRWDRIRTVAALWNVDAMNSLDVPWWTWTAIRDVDDFLARRRDVRAFEWGSGASTMWLARRCDSVVSVEHDRTFASQTAPMLATLSNVTVIVREPRQIRRDDTGGKRSGKHGYEDLDFSEYVAAIETGAVGPFEVIVVDGRARADCLQLARKHLTDDGCIVLDNSDRARYQPAIEAVDRDASVVRHRGRGPGSPLAWETAIIRPDRCGRRATPDHSANTTS